MKMKPLSVPRSQTEKKAGKIFFAAISKEQQKRVREAVFPEKEPVLVSAMGRQKQGLNETGKSIRKRRMQIRIKEKGIRKAEPPFKQAEKTEHSLKKQTMPGDRKENSAFKTGTREKSKETGGSDNKENMYIPSWTPVLKKRGSQTKGRGKNARLGGNGKQEVPKEIFKKVKIRRKRRDKEEAEEILNSLPLKKRLAVYQKAERSVRRNKKLRRGIKTLSLTALSKTGDQEKQEKQEKRMDDSPRQVLRAVFTKHYIKNGKRAGSKTVEKEAVRIAGKKLAWKKRKEKMKKNLMMKEWLREYQRITHRYGIEGMAKKAGKAVANAAAAVVKSVAAGIWTLCSPVILFFVFLLVLVLLLNTILGGGIAGNSGASGEDVARYAVSFVGKIPYLYGAGREYNTLEEIVSAGGMADCSAYTQRVFRHFNVEIGGSTYEQQNTGSEVSVDNLQPGDLLLFDNHSGGQQPGHVGIYIGDGKVVHEGGGNYTGNVKIDSLSYFTVMSARRVAVTGMEADFSGNGVPEICWNFYISQGFSEAATAGILANIQAESGFLPAVLEQGGANSGHGLCQWGDSKTGGRFYNLEAFAAQRGTDWTDVETQLLFVMQELNGPLAYYFNTYCGGVEAYKNMTDPAAAAKMWLICYEMCGPNYDPVMAQESDRMGYAWNFYQTYAGL